MRTGTLVRGEWLTGVSEVESRLSGWAAQREVPFLSLTEAFRVATQFGAIHPHKAIQFFPHGSAAEYQLGIIRQSCQKSAAITHLEDRNLLLQGFQRPFCWGGAS